MHGGGGRGGDGRAGGGGGAGGVAVVQEAGGGGSIRVLLLKGGVGVLGVGGAVVQVRAGADRRRHLGGQHQAGLHEGLGVHVRLGQPAHTTRWRGSENLPHAVHAAPRRCVSGV